MSNSNSHIQSSNNQVTNVSGRKLHFSFLFLVEIAIGVMLLGVGCVLTPIFGLREYNSGGQWITIIGGTEFIFMIVTLLVLGIIGITFIMFGFEQLSSGTAVYIFKLFFGFNWSGLFKFFKKVVMDGIDVIRHKEPTQSINIQPAAGDTEIVNREKFISVVSAFHPLKIFRNP